MNKMSSIPRRSKCSKYLEQQFDIVANIVDILDLHRNHTHILDNMDDNITLHTFIMDLTPDIRKYYNCNNLKAVTDPSRIKRPWLSIIKTILKPYYNIKREDYHFTNKTGTKKYVHTKKYTFEAIDKSIIFKYTEAESIRTTDFMKKYFEMEIEQKQISKEKIFLDLSHYLRLNHLHESDIERVESILLQDGSPWTASELNRITSNKAFCPIRESLIGWSVIEPDRFPSIQTVCNMGSDYFKTDEEY